MLLVIVIVAAVSLLVAHTISFLSLGELELGDKVSQGEKSLQVAEACLEEALKRIREDNSYEVSNKSLIFFGEECVFSVSQSGAQITINAADQNSDYQREISAQAEITNNQVRIVKYQVGSN